MSSESDLQQRVAVLEERVGTLSRELRELRSTLAAPPARATPAPLVQQAGGTEAPGSMLTPAASTASGPQPAAPPLPPPPVPRRIASAEVVRGGEYWFNKVGIGLLLLGLAFLFNYAIDQGWLTPAVRVGIGLLAGSVLIGIGLRLSAARRSFAVVLMGGGIAALYLSGFAAFQLYQLVAYPLAFGFMCLVTALAFGLAVRQDALMLALIGTIGGLATPFLLYSNTGSVAGLAGYVSIVLTGATAIYLVRGWRPLLWLTAVGGWAVLFSAYSAIPLPPAGSLDRWALEAAVIWVSFLFWPLPLLWHFRSPAAGQDPSLPAPRLDDLYGQIVATPFLALALTGATWDLGKLTAGWIALALAGLTMLVAWALRGRPRSGLLPYVHTLSALLMLTWALALLLDGNALLIALAVEAGLAHAIAGRRQDRIVAGLAHLIFVGLFVEVLRRLVEDSAVGTVLLNLPALTSLAVLGLGVAASLGMYPRKAAPAYWLVAHLLLLGLLARELWALPDGNGYVTIAWGVWGLALLLGGLRFDRATITLFGIGTLLLVVAKLLLIDLAALAAIWRILLFMGFGAAFLLLSYYFRALWRPRGEASVVDSQ